MCTTTAIKVINAKAKCSTRAFYIYTVKRTLQCKFYFFLSCTCLCFLKHQVTYLYPVPFTAICQNR